MKTIHLFSLALLSLLCACSGEQDAVDGTPSAESLPVRVAQVSAAGAAACSFTDMAHVYSRIRLTLTRGAASESTGAYSITNINFTNGATNIATSAPKYIQRQTVTPNYTCVGWDYNPDITLSAGATAPVIDLLVPPQSVALGLSMVFTIDGCKRSVTIPQGLFAGENLVAGEQYSIALTLRDVAITMSETVHIGYWTQETNGAVVPGYADNVPYVVLRDINLRVAQADWMCAGVIGHWLLALDQGDYTGRGTGGDYFCRGIADSTSSADY